MNGLRLWTNGGSGSSSILMPPIGVPELFCSEVNVPHSWMIRGSPARLLAATSETPKMTARHTTIRHARNISHLVFTKDTTWPVNPHSEGYTMACNRESC